MAMAGPHTPTNLGSGSAGLMQDRSGMGLSRTASDAASGRRFGEASFAVYVGNLAPSVTDDALHEAFKHFGTITKAQVIRNADGSNRGFGFVNFIDEEPMKSAMAQMNDARVPHIPAFENRALRVKPSEKNQNFAQQQRQQQHQQQQQPQ